MKAVYFLPCAQIALCLGCALVYGFAYDWRKVIYWSAAAVITASVTF